MLRDLRTALRQLRTAPGFAAVVALTLALGVAATTATFTLVNAIFFRPVPGVAEPGQVVRLFSTASFEGRVMRNGPFPLSDVRALAARTDLFAGVTASGRTSVVVGSGDAARTANAALVEGSYFRVLGVRPALGRTFVPEEDVRGGPAAVAVLSHRLWTERFGGDPALVGRTVTANGRRVQVVGIAPAEFRGDDIETAPDLWLPIAAAPLLRTGDEALLAADSRWLRASARLRDGVSLERARAAVEAMARDWVRADAKGHEGTGIRLAPGGTLVALDPAGVPQVIAVFAALTVLAGLVLVVTAANAANLLVARASRRRREIALRSALGAVRGRLVRQLLAESLVLAGGAGVLGVALTYGAAALMPGLGLPATLDFTPDARVLGFALVVALLTGVLFGLAPALHATRTALAPALRDGGAGSGRTRSRLRSALVVAQVGVSLVLLVAAGALLRTVDGLRRANLGFDAPRVLVATLDVGMRGLDEARAQALYAQLVERVRAVPGVEAAAIGTSIPFGARVEGTIAMPAEARDARAGRGTMLNAVSPGYLATMRVPLVGGRAIDARDLAGSGRVAVVSETAARTYWPGASPVGQRLRLDGKDGPVHEVVGVARDARFGDLTGAPTPMVYVPLAQRHASPVVLQVRSTGPAGAAAPAVRAALRELAPDLPFGEVRALTAYRDEAMLPSTLMARLLGIFGTAALVVAAVGLGGVVAFTVAERTREIGVRLALGADAGAVVRLVVGQGMRLAGVGIALGLPVAAGGAWLLARQLQGVQGADGLTIGIPVGVLALVAAAASWGPARRASRLAPAVVLRAE